MYILCATVSATVFNLLSSSNKLLICCKPLATAIAPCTFSKLFCRSSFSAPNKAAVPCTTSNPAAKPCTACKPASNFNVSLARLLIRVRVSPIWSSSRAASLTKFLKRWLVVSPASSSANISFFKPRKVRVKGSDFLVRLSIALALLFNALLISPPLNAAAALLAALLYSAAILSEAFEALFTASSFASFILLTAASNSPASARYLISISAIAVSFIKHFKFK